MGEKSSPCLVVEVVGRIAEVEFKPRFRAGDVVYHRPTKETWILAYGGEKHYRCAKEPDVAAGKPAEWEPEEEVSACGWPESIAKADDCDLVEAATDEAHEATLTEWAKRHRVGGGSDDRRIYTCFRQLARRRGLCEECGGGDTEFHTATCPTLLKAIEIRGRAIRDAAVRFVTDLETLDDGKRVFMPFETCAVYEALRVAVQAPLFPPKVQP